MADIKYQVAVDSKGGIDSLKQLQNQVKQTQDTFSGFQKVLGALALGSAIRSAYQMANALTDLSAASGVAVQTLIGFGRAIAANGGSVDAANAGISRFARFIAESTEGNKKAQDTLFDLGISLKDLGTLSEQDLLRKTISGLSKVTDNAQRTAKGMEIFGKAFAAVDYRGVNAGLDGFIQRAGSSAAAVAAAGEAQQNFSNTIATVQTELLRALKPLSELAVKITENADAVGQWVRSIVEFVKWFAIIAGGVLIFTKLGLAALAVAAGFRSLLAVAGNIPNLIRAIFNPVTRNNLLKELSSLGSVGRSAGVLLGAMGNRVENLIKKFPLFAGAATAAAAALREFFSNPGIKDAEAAIEAETKALKEGSHWTQVARENKERQLRLVEDARTKERQALEETVDAYKRGNVEFQKQFDLQTKILSMSEEQRVAVETISQTEQEYLKQIEPLLKKYKETAESKNENELKNLPLIQKAIQAISEEYKKNLPIVQSLINARIEELAIQKEMAYQTELATQATERRLAVEEQLRNVILDGADRVKRAYESAELDGLVGIQRTLREIEIEERRLAESAKRRVAEQFGDNDPEGFLRAVDQIEAASERVIRSRQEAVKSITDQQRTFSSGWELAFKQYSNDATNAAKSAESIFKKATQGMEDAIVNFAKTGKFEFKSFLSSIVEELLRSQIRQLLAQVFGGLGGGGGSGGSVILGALKTFGGFFANGGTLGAGKWGIAGEAGPELISGPANITPMDGMSPSATYVTYNISAVDAMSFKQMLARDPSFLYAVTEQGRRSLPGGRR